MTQRHIASTEMVCGGYSAGMNQTCGFPTTLHARLKELAQQERRFLHAQVLHIVKQAVPAQPEQS
ncbi:hypothetical protein [Nonomuraea bangladeshensis]|uniref:hypothetical protein n=1 Tax=Nonomuraea bangladeshensis TaxID=404385 RepID=UPI003C2BF1C3